MPERAVMSDYRHGRTLNIRPISARTLNIVKRRVASERDLQPCHLHCVHLAIAATAMQTENSHRTLLRRHRTAGFEEGGCLLRRPCAHAREVDWNVVRHRRGLQVEQLL